MKRSRFAHYAAPLAFLAAVTIAVLLIRSALNSGSHPAAPQTTTTQTTTAAHHRRHHPTHGHVRKYTVRSGDTLASIAQKNGTSVARLEQLNPGINPTALQVGEKIRVR